MKREQKKEKLNKRNYANCVSSNYCSIANTSRSNYNNGVR